jgi:hypothetical protein
VAAVLVAADGAAAELVAVPVLAVQILVCVLFQEVLAAQLE